MAIIRDLISTDASFAAYEGPFFRPILDIQLNGTAIGDLDSKTLGLPDCTALDREEIVSVANVLAVVGYADANMEKAARGHAPDFLVESPRAGKLYVEHTRAVHECVNDSAHLFLHDAATLTQDTTFAAAIDGLIILVTVEHSAIPVGPLDALTRSCPGEHMTRREASSALAELRTLAASGYFKAVCGAERASLIPGDKAPTLARFRAEAHVGPKLDGSSGTFQPSSRRYMPRRMSLWELCRGALGKKTLPPPGYVTAKSPPAALVIHVTVGTHELDYDLDEHETPDITPFKHVGIALWHNWSLIVAGWSRSEDGGLRTFAPPLPPIPDATDHDLHAWADDVEDLLLSRWYREGLSGQRLPNIFITPVQVMWYRKWFGPGRWVNCERSSDKIIAQFWFAADRANVDTRTFAINEPLAASEAIWQFVVG